MHGLDFGCQLGTRQNAGVNIKIIDIGVHFNSKGPLSNRDSGGRQERRNWEWGGREGTGYLILNKRACFVLKISACNRRKCTGFGDAGTGCESELFHLPAVCPWESHSTSLSSGFHLRNQRCVLAFSGGWGPKGNNTQEQAAQGGALRRASHGFSSPYTYLPFKESAGLEITELWMDRQSPRGNCGLTKNRPFDQMIKSLSYANVWTGRTLGQFSRSKLQLIFEEIACSLAFPQLCHPLSHTAAFVTARTIWDTWQGRPFWGKMLNNIDIHTHTHYKSMHTWAGRYVIQMYPSLCVYMFIPMFGGLSFRNNSAPLLYTAVCRLCKSL